MKPIVLTMKAFGTYAKETKVEFNKLKPGLYLITGDTGAGKTTIFDAMCFALYGQASGTGRSTEMFHSDYVAKSEDTIVGLEFEHNNKKYYVERKIHYAKKRNSEDYELSSPSAILKEEGKMPIEKASVVTNRIEEILGLNVNQFRQIIVLAQGEFQKFLKADSKGRNEILGKLFDNYDYVNFQVRLKKASDKLYSLIQKSQDALSFALESFDIDEEERINYLPDNPELINNIEKLIFEQTNIYNNLIKDIKDINDKKEIFLNKKSVAIEHNKALKHLSDLKEVYIQLMDKKDNIDVLRSNLERVEVAYHNVYPVEEKAKYAKGRYITNEENLRSKEKELVVAKDNLLKIIKDSEIINDLNVENDKLKSELKELEELSKKFEPYNLKKKELDTLYKKRNNNTIKLDKLNTDIIAFNELSKILKEKEDKLEEKTSLYDKYSLIVEKDTQLYNQIIKEDGLIAMVNTIKELSEKLEKNNKELLLITRNVVEKKANYDQVYNSFIKGQSALLAKQLKMELSNNDSVECPVCHSVIDESMSNRLVVDDISIYSQDDVDKAYKAFNDKENKRIELANKKDIFEIQINSGKDNVIKYLKDLDIVVDNYDILDDTYLNDIKTRFKDKLDESNKLLNEVELAKKDLVDIKKQIKDNDELIENNNKEKEELIVLSAKDDQEFASLSKEVELLFKGLQGYTKEDVSNKLDDNNEKIDSNNKKIIELNDSKEKANSKCSELSGMVVTLKEKHIQYEKEYKEECDKLANKIKENKFTDFNEYSNTLKIVEGSYEEWIEGTRKDINDYDVQLKTNIQEIANQKKICENIKEVDISALDIAINELSYKYQEMDKKKISLITKINSYNKVLLDVKKYSKTISSYLPAYKRLASLSMLANGYTSDTGKITFDRYALGSAFEEILQAANIHLSVMTGGKYVLIHQTKGSSKVSAAGLEIDVLDTFTNERRKPDSLSGGESFQVSMSLALGLSDVVQSHANGKRIESMYIDEGFGSLDESVLDKAIEVLKNIAQNNIQIGIISHVARLEESINQKIVVKGSKQGSTLTIIE